MNLVSESSEDSSGDSSYCYDGKSTVKTLDYSYMMINNQTLENNIGELEVGNVRDKKPEIIQKLFINNNLLTELPRNISSFQNLRHIDVSNNRLSSIPEELLRLPLITLSAKNNHISNDNLPKSFLPWASTLLKLHLGRNNLNHFPPQIFDLHNLECLYLGNNHIEDLPRNIHTLTRLKALSVGGNLLSEIPDTISDIENLEMLVVSDNKLENLPPGIADLKKLKILLLHKNRLRTLPREIIRLEALSELSLRDNPLVVKFVNDMTYNPASLLETSARVIKVSRIPYSPEDLPQCLLDYLNSAHYCVNPNCNGVYFDTRVEHVKFVDFCGKYRVPLLQYLCSSKCVLDNSNLYKDDMVSFDVMRKVLLG